MNHNDLTYRLASEDDVRQYFEWANNPEVRKQSFSSDKIIFEEHQSWFKNKLKSNKSLLIMYFLGKDPVGQLRLDIINDNLAEIDYSVDDKWRGKGIGVLILQSAKHFAEKVFPGLVLKGVVLAGNLASVKSFKRAGFIKEEKLILNQMDCFAYYTE